MVVGTKTRGFSVVEVLIAVALMAVLITSVAAAVHAALQSYRENELITSMTQSARSILTRMMRDVRTADEVDSTSASLSILPPDDGSGVTLIRYELAGGTLFYRRTVGSTTTSEVLLAPEDQVSVDSFIVTRQTGLRDTLIYTQSVTAQITFTAGAGRTFTVTASADPRRNQEY
jgi:prepilin-type N-terminal cleavage/methylation domain-containing protein